METNKTIIAENVISEKGNYVWKVSIAGSRSKKNIVYCITPLKAIRACYFLSKQTGADISEVCLRRLRTENTRRRVPTPEEVVTEESE